MKTMDKVRAHREILKHNLFNYDWSNTPVDKLILVELDYNHITIQEEGPDGFTHCKSSFCNTERLINYMNKQVVRQPEYDLVIMDKAELI